MPFPGRAGDRLVGAVRRYRACKDICRSGIGQIAGMSPQDRRAGSWRVFAFLMQRHISVHDFEEFIEVHPSTDGVNSLAKYHLGTVQETGRS